VTAQTAGVSHPESSQGPSVRKKAWGGGAPEVEQLGQNPALLYQFLGFECVPQGSCVGNLLLSATVLGSGSE
jgi:hypothetical protein